jgi:hypothetical protein
MSRLLEPVANDVPGGIARFHWPCPGPADDPEAEAHLCDRLHVLEGEPTPPGGWRCELHAPPVQKTPDPYTSRGTGTGVDEAPASNKPARPWLGFCKYHTRYEPLEVLTALHRTDRDDLVRFTHRAPTPGGWSEISPPEQPLTTDQPRMHADRFSTSGCDGEIP